MSDIFAEFTGKLLFVKNCHLHYYAYCIIIEWIMSFLEEFPHLEFGIWSLELRMSSMFPEALRDISRPSCLGIIGELKRSGGLAIPELAKLLDMSYMGVKQHCVRLEEQGYLKVWRVPRVKVGRPQKLYKLTHKCDSLFPCGGAELVLQLLEGVKVTFGETAPEKLLYHYFEKERDEWIKSVRPGKSLVEKATRFADARMKSGHFCHCHYSANSGFIIEEYHHPLHRVFKLYPGLLVMEIRMIEQVLGTRVVRSESKGSQGVKCTVYQISTLG
jgi:predicted ArsR family transcriptional regulator